MISYLYQRGVREHASVCSARRQLNPWHDMILQSLDFSRDVPMFVVFRMYLRKSGKRSVIRRQPLLHTLASNI